MQSFELPFRGPRRRTRVRVGRGVLQHLADDLAADPPGSPLVLISDDNVMPLHGAPLAQALAARGLDVECLSFPAGEVHKSRESKAMLEDELCRLAVGRDGAVLAFGGGVTGDLAGFVAATWHRGIPFVSAPTSVLAMVDASIGGKTGINLAAGKNLVGAFHQPLAIYADTETLATLPDRRYREGFAEVIKAAAIADVSLFDTLEGAAADLLQRRQPTLDLILGAAMRIKGALVTRDVRERGVRAGLNFGHTLGHALESERRYTMPHGEAVAVGMLVEAELAVEIHGFPREAVARLESLLERFELPTRLPADCDLDTLLASTLRDKKNRHGRVRYALPRAPGAMPAGEAVTVEVPEALVAEVVSRRKC